jgi:integrase/recombinase XerD
MATKPLDVEKTVRLRLDQAVRRYLTDREDNNCSPDTMRWYRQKLSQLQRSVQVTQLEDVSRDQLLELVSDLRHRGRSAPYIRGWYQVFRGFFGWARVEGYLIHDSLINERADRWFTLKKPIQTQPDIDTFSEEELDRIYQAAGSQRNVIFCRLLVGTGLRLSEALALTLDDLEDDRLRVRVGKGRKFRPVPVNRGLQRDLTRYIERVREDGETDHIFLARAGDQWSQSAATATLQRIKKQTRLPVHAHAFRHTFATEYLRRGGEIDRLRRILGHTTFAMTARYAHLAGVDLNHNIDRLTN